MHSNGSCVLDHPLRPSHHHECSYISIMVMASLHFTAREEPAVSYKWTGWVWETTGWVQDFKIFTDHLEESIEEYTSNEWKHQTRKMSTCNQLDFESLGSCPPTLHMPINFLGTEWYNSYWSTYWLWILNININMPRGYVHQ